MTNVCIQVPREKFLRTQQCKWQPFIPSYFKGRAWMKHVGHSTLYIHELPDLSQIMH